MAKSRIISSGAVAVLTMLALLSFVGGLHAEGCPEKTNGHCKYQGKICDEPKPGHCKDTFVPAPLTEERGHYTCKCVTDPTPTETPTATETETPTPTETPTATATATSTGGGAGSEGGGGGILAGGTPNAILFFLAALVLWYGRRLVVRKRS